MMPSLSALAASGVCLAARARAPAPKSAAGLTPDWIFPGLICLVFALGALLIVLAVLTWNAPELDEPADRLQGDRHAREGRWLVLVGLLFPLAALLLLKTGMGVDAMFLPILALLIVALWGGGRVLVAAGGSRRPGKQLLLGGLGVLFAGSVALVFGYLFWRQLLW